MIQRDPDFADQVMADYFPSSNELQVHGRRVIMPNMRLAQIELINHYYPYMDKITQQRANTTLAYLASETFNAE